MAPPAEDLKSVSEETLIGLRDAYIAFQIGRCPGSSDRDRLESWLDALMEDAGMADYVNDAVQRDWESRKAEHSKT